MKKTVYLLIACAGLLLASCEKEEIGGTATQALAGEWYVMADGVDNDFNLIPGAEDIFGMAHFKLNTYNTVENIPTKMYVDDRQNFWWFKVIVDCDVKALTFSTNGEWVTDEYYGCGVLIEKGQILPGAATTPHGTPADSIVFYVSFDDDPYPAYGYYDKLRISGYRYTGLAQDDDPNEL